MQRSVKIRKASKLKIEDSQNTFAQGEGYENRGITDREGLPGLMTADRSSFIALATQTERVDRRPKRRTLAAQDKPRKITGLFKLMSLPTREARVGI